MRVVNSRQPLKLAGSKSMNRRIQRKTVITMRIPSKTKATAKIKIKTRKLFLLLLFMTTSIILHVNMQTWAFLPSMNGSIIRRMHCGDSPCIIHTTVWSTKKDEDISFTTEPETKATKKKSRISVIKCSNIAGMTNGQRMTPKGNNNNDDEGIIALNLDDDDDHDHICGGNLISITGETGSGKSLLVSKVASLVTGGKASVSLLGSNTNNLNTDMNDAIVDDENSNNNNKNNNSSSALATVEMVLTLYDRSHFSFVTKKLQDLGLDPNIIKQQYIPEMSETESFVPPVILDLKRTISLSSTKNKNQRRVKSKCFINDHLVSLKALKAIASPLVAVVDASAAAAALRQPSSRLSIIDSGIPPTVLKWVQQLQTTYQKRKRERQKLQNNLEQRVLPFMFRSGTYNDDDIDDDEQSDLLRHWIDELDGFERRILDLQQFICSNLSSKQSVDFEMERLLQDLDGFNWSSQECTSDDSFSSVLYSTLLDLYDYLKDLDSRIISAEQARDALASLSASDSARTALDRTRQLLLNAGSVDNYKSKTATKRDRTDIASEKAHHMLNHVEDALSECAAFLDDDDKSLLKALKETRKFCPITTVDLLERITEWNTLARKHGIPPHQLPYCHENLREELDGSVEVGKMLPEAEIAEKTALKELEVGCQTLTQARSTLCQRISTSISRRLPQLGMENLRFKATLCPIETPSYSRSHMGAENVDFYLLQDDKMSHDNYHNHGKIENVASSGEKARILLAIECEIPGSISSIGSIDAVENSTGGSISPVAVIYDEIDAHVGGQASISVAQMLFDQSNFCQILSITHSPSLAAIADTHICIRKGKPDNRGRLSIEANRVVGIERRKELARMASGDVAVEEAEIFAEALLRDARIKARA